MFSSDFFPTPPEVIELMIGGEDLQAKHVWEPEGGKGDLVRALQAAGAKVIASENNQDLRKILQTICPLVGSDMLQVTSDQVSHVQYIVMNPPFSAAAQHIAHAYKIAPPGCKLIALANAETVRNAYSKSREELKELIANYGQSQDIGQAFDTAERKTGAEVVLIRLDKPGAASDEFSGFFLDEEQEPQADGLITYNVVRDLVNRYVESIKVFDAQLDTATRLNELMAGYLTVSPELAIVVSRLGAPLERNKFRKEMQISGWNCIFSKLNMQKYATRGLREDINKFVETQEQVPFTMKNIYKMLEIVVGTAGARMDKALLEMFDRVTEHHHENRHGVEGWQTNSHYLLNRRFIIPRMAPIDKWNEGNKINNAYGSYFDMMEDLTKALCYIDGKQYEDMNELREVCRGWSGEEGKKSEPEKEYGAWFNWEFFKVKFFKKGTAHFEFLDEKLWAKFNTRIAKLKGFPLPEKKEQTKWQQQRQGTAPKAKKEYKVMETIKL